MSNWHLAIAGGICMLLIACSRRDGLQALSPVFATRANMSAPEVANCIVRRWKQSTRQLGRSESAGEITLRAKSFFNGVPVGVRIMPDGGHSLVEYFRQRRADPLYSQMVRECLHLQAPPNEGSTRPVPRS